MAMFTVLVGVALSRPPRTDEYRKTLVEAPTPLAAELLACQIAECTSVMAVSSEVIDHPRERKPINRAAEAALTRLAANPAPIG